MNGEIIAAIIGAIGGIVAAIIGVVANRKYKKNEELNGIRFMNKEENPCKLVTEVDKVRMYSVNSYILFNLVKTHLSQNPNASVSKMTLIVRKKSDESKSDLDILKQIIENWHSLVKEKRIKELRIIAIPLDSCHFYSVMGDKMMFLGLVKVNDALPTNTDVDYRPIFFDSESSIGKEMIQKYVNHFDELESLFAPENTLYDSTTAQCFNFEKF